MPESVRDRPTKSHEYIFLLTKNARYFYDQEAIREAHSEGFLKGHNNWTPRKGFDTNDYRQSSAGQHKGGFNDYLNRQEIYVNPAGRNSRTVWEITTQPYPEAHFATFPEELPRRCIKAGTSQKGCCPKCDAPWERIIKATFIQEGPTRNRGRIKIFDASAKSMTMGDGGKVGHNDVETLGWQPTCECGETETIACTVLDPFAGSGTVGWVARSLSRKAILIELNPIYGEMIEERSMSNVPDIMGFEEVCQ